MLQSYKGRKTSCYSPFKCQKSYGKISLKAKNPTEIKIGQNVTAMGRPKLRWVKMSHCDKPSIFWDGQIIHPLWVRISQEKIITGLKCHSGKLSQWTKNFVDILCGSEGRMVGLWVDVTSRHRFWPAKFNPWALKNIFRATAWNFYV